MNIQDFDCTLPAYEAIRRKDKKPKTGIPLYLYINRKADHIIRSIGGERKTGIAKRIKSAINKKKKELTNELRQDYLYEGGRSINYVFQRRNDEPKKFGLVWALQNLYRILFHRK